ncbi:hypothetical protein SPRG_04903 [Saprolegnia parasitica CBS 223.65]|uniref:Uncharacterized protein n=1 Tax=Saprolegnia parasitica (strain CBS 223.65) TaxID=695850 RepID=A0A067CH27_SAPPC|nr:hypothetical protein SPRG_04903 [Saprolegnia parasitica CBS 223.65]KDO29788.1 hypothetical protein SPRG_04903 [Saprolegnia parasitica CBS 223.65]|eukprot:XP_012199433.1 hypothetical protein SPRG_04903 [Saprolegnia parasitica CBS 223.65]
MSHQTNATAPLDELNDTIREGQSANSILRTIENASEDVDNSTEAGSFSQDFLGALARAMHNKISGGIVAFVLALIQIIEKWISKAINSGLSSVAFALQKLQRTCIQQLECRSVKY